MPCSTSLNKWLTKINHFWFPGQQVAEQPERSSCSRYMLDQVQNLSTLGSLELVHNLSTLGSSPEILLSSLKQEGCKDGWNYSTEYYHSTVVTEVHPHPCPPPCDCLDYIMLNTNSDLSEQFLLSNIKRRDLIPRGSSNEKLTMTGLRSPASVISLYDVMLQLMLSKSCSNWTCVFNFISDFPIKGVWHWHKFLNITMIANINRPGGCVCVCVCSVLSLTKVRTNQIFLLMSCSVFSCCHLRFVHSWGKFPLNLEL